MLAHLILSHSFVPSICFDMLPPECLISSSSSLGVIYCPCMFFFAKRTLFAWFHFFSHLAALIIITKSSVLVYNKMAAAAATVRLLSLVCGGHVSLVVSFSSLIFFGF